MAQTVGQHPIATFTSPTNGDLLDATVVKGNDNTTRDAYVAHDADPGIHLQSSLLAARPAAGEAGRKWLTTDTGSIKLWFDTGAAWQEISYVSTGNLPTNLIPSVTNTYDIGSSSLKWKDVYAQGNVSVGGGLSAGGALSAGSATVTNDLTVDTNTLKVDSTNNRVGIGTATPTVALDVIGAASVRSVEFDGTTSGTVTMQPAAAAGTWSLTLPTTPGTSGQFLSTDGSGVTTWASQSGGFTDVSITPTVAAPYQVTTADVSKRLVMNSSVTGGINFTPANTNSIPVGSTMKIASFGAGTTINTLDGTLSQLPFDNYGYQGGQVYSFATLTDGSVLVGGNYTIANGASRIGLTRITSGAIDTTFVAFTGGTESALALAVQSDGKIIVGGYFTTIFGTTRGSLARLNANGTFDSTFADPQVTSAGSIGVVNTVAIQSDGKIIIGGQFDNVAGTARNNIARLNADGTLDTTYNPNADSNVQIIRLQSDGKALVGGLFLTIGGASRTRLARLLTTGANDSTFANPNANGLVYALAVQSDGKMVIGGAFTSVAGTARNFIARVNTDGTLDTTYNPNGNSQVRSIALQSDGKAVVGGAFTTISATARVSLARINTDGTLDTTYSNPNVNSTVNVVVMQSSGSALIGGAFTTVNSVLMMGAASVPSTGTLVPVFGPNFNNRPYCWAQQSDGKIIVGGLFTSVNGVTRQYLARLNSNGTLDTTFADPQLNNVVQSVAVQSDGKIIAVGDFTLVAGSTARNYIARFNTDGTLDTAYDPNANSTCSMVVLQSDGKALVGGNFTTVGGGSRTRIARLNTNGTLDTTFTSATTFNTYAVTTILVASDGNIYAANFTQGPVRLTTTGASDTSWTNQNCGAYTMALQSNGQLVIGGGFTTVGSTTRNYIARLSAIGALDLNFNPNANSTVYGVLALADGRIVVQGAFNTINGLTRNGLALLASNGSDSGVSYVGGSSPTNNNLFVRADRNVLLGGSFIALNNVYRSYAAQLDFSSDGIYAPYGGQNLLARYSVITLEKLAAGSWAITESNCS